MTEGNSEKVERTSAGLRGALFDELDGLRSGAVNATKANATAKIALAIVSTVEMEMEAYKLLNKIPAKKTADEPHRLPTLPLVG